MDGGNRTVLQKPNKGITIIKTKNLNGVNTFPNASARRCTEPNCFTQSIEYHASNEQIKVRMVFANETINQGYIKGSVIWNRVLTQHFTLMCEFLVRSPSAVSGKSKAQKHIQMMQRCAPDFSEKRAR